MQADSRYVGFFPQWLKSGDVDTVRLRTSWQRSRHITILPRHIRRKDISYRENYSHGRMS
jgi:hypothetical protein